MWRCTGCETVYRLSIVRCTRCHSTSLRKVAGVPKISRARGVLPAVADPADAPLVNDDQDEPTPEGGEQPSAGNSSETSLPKQPTSSEPNKTDPPKRARTTESRSGKARTGSSSARSTAGSGTASTDD